MSNGVEKVHILESLFGTEMEPNMDPQNPTTSQKTFEFIVFSSGPDARGGAKMDTFRDRF